MAQFMELAQVFEELEKLTSHKEIVRKIADLFLELEGEEEGKAHSELSSAQPSTRKNSALRPLPK
jgi:DNA ligase-1